MPDPQFSNDEIQQRAYEIYQARGGTPGDPNADWQEAIRQLQQERSTPQKRSAFSWLNRSLVRLEKEAIEPTANWLDKADIFRIIEKISPIIEAIGVIAIPVAIWWFSETSQEAQEQQEKAIRAQTAVQNYLNQLSDILTTGKLETDEDLQTIVRASTLALLDNPDLQPDPALEDWENRQNDRKGQVIGYLIETGLFKASSPEPSQGNNQPNAQEELVISLKDANLSGANLFDADLSFADLYRAELRDANLDSANLSGANLFRADLFRANLNGADLSGADLSGAILRDANLRDAFLSVTNLYGANFRDADLSGAHLRDTDLSSADLSNTDLSDADLRGANLSDAVRFDINLVSPAENLTDEQISEAKLCKTKLPAGTNLDPDRDCKELGISPD